MISAGLRTASVAVALGLLAGCGSNNQTPDAGLAPDGHTSQADGKAAADAPRTSGDRGPVVDPDLGPPREAGVPPANATCAKPQLVALQGGKASVAGDTLDAPDELGGIGCNDQMGPWVGGQVYYKVALAAGKKYKVRLKPSGADLALYAFPASTACDKAAIDAACTGLTRDTPDIPPVFGQPEEMLLAPSAAGDWMIVVDSYSELQLGAFVLTVEEYTLPANTTCAKAEKVTLSAGAVKVSGDTLGAPNEQVSLACGEKPAKPGDPIRPYLGPQLYYAVDLVGGTKYRINTKTENYARVYVFPQTVGCAESAIEAACASGGQNGAMSVVNMNTPTDLYFTPSKTQTYVIAVDSTGPILYGPFTVEITEYTVPVVNAPVSFDFENGNCGGFAATGDWACGKLAFTQGPNCKLGSQVFGVPPTAGHSGMGMWATGLTDCYSALNNASKVDDKAVVCTNLNPDDDSILKFKVVLPSTWSTAKLTYWSWEDINSPYDWAEIRVNKKVAYQHCEATYTKPTAWVKRTVDLSNFVGTTAEIGFHFMASTFVNYAGWYLDDLEISGS